MHTYTNICIQYVCVYVLLLLATIVKTVQMNWLSITSLKNGREKKKKRQNERDQHQGKGKYCWCVVDDDPFVYFLIGRNGNESNRYFVRILYYKNQSLKNCPLYAFSIKMLCRGRMNTANGKRQERNPEEFTVRKEE